MAKPFLTLNIPAKGLAAGTPVVACQNPGLLRLFKEMVLREWQRRIQNNEDEVLAQIDSLEYEKLEATLDLLIPDGEVDEEKAG